MTTLNLQVGAAGDDGRAFGSSSPPDTFSNSGTVTIGDFSIYIYNPYARFTGVSGLSGATISEAIFTITSTGSPLTAGDVESIVFCADAESPAAPTNISEFNAITPTTAQVTWDFDASAADAAGFASVDLQSPVQELADDYDPSAILVKAIDDGSADDNIFVGVDHDNSPSDAPTLDIDYTAAGAGPTIDVPAGSLGNTGQVPSASGGKSVAAPLGGLTDTGQVPAIPTGASVQVPLGGLGYTGLTPSPVPPHYEQVSFRFREDDGGLGAP